MQLRFVLIMTAVLVLGQAGQALEEFNWGTSGTVPVTGDYDGDGKTDPALYDQATGYWFICLSSQNYQQYSALLGGPSFIPVPYDYDGDGKLDPAVYSEGTGQWIGYLSANGYQPSFVTLGGPGFKPVPGDYNGDGLTDLAVYRASDGHWSIWLRSLPEVTDMNELAIMYSNATVMASSSNPDAICRTLTAITPENTNLYWRTNSITGARQVKVISFMRSDIASNYYHVGGQTSLKGAASWVTLAPELKNFCLNYTGTNLLLRVKQLLGLPATSRNNTVVEFWVDPSYLARPAPDPEITDHEAELNFRTNQVFVAAVDTNYVSWFQGNIIASDYGMTNGVWGGALPWTRLGYTYDWANSITRHVGLSEFVIIGPVVWNAYHAEVIVDVALATNLLDYATAPDPDNLVEHNQYGIAQNTIVAPVD